jgi:hypothetical protein
MPSSCACLQPAHLPQHVVGCTLSVLLSVMVSHCGFLDCYHRCAASACPWLVEVAGVDGWWALLCHALWLPQLIIICLVLLCGWRVPQASVGGGKELGYTQRWLSAMLLQPVVRTRYELYSALVLSNVHSVNCSYSLM